MIKTIPRNHTKRIAELKATLTRCRVYTLENYFHGQDTDPANAWRALDRGAKLTEGDGGKFTIQVHSNCWYELRAGGES